MNLDKAIQLVKRITEYLRSRLGPGQWFTLSIEKIKEDKITAESESIDGKELGRFRFAITSYQIYATIYVDLEKENYLASLNYYWVHPSGGRNGYQLPFVLRGSIKNEITIVEVVK